MTEPSNAGEGYEALKRHHSHAYEYLSRALEIDEAGQGM